MESLLGLMLVMFAYLGTVQVTLVEGPVIATNAPGVSHVTTAKATWDGRIEGTRGALGATWAERMADERIMQNVVHELLHLVDLRDDGAYNGSLLPYPPTSGDPAHEYVYWALRNPDTAARAIERMGR